MSSASYRAPFHRQILPWLFAILFLALAPALIFHTSGYRYNSKKQTLERNGVMIVDSQPSGAAILLDGENTQETTPVTLQDVTPGAHRLRLEKAGYQSWEKTLNVRPEQVTFADRVWLWKINEPRLVQAGSVLALSADPNGDLLAVVERQTTSTSLALWTPGTNLIETGQLAQFGPEARLSLRWRPDGGALLLNGLGNDRTTFIADRNDATFQPRSLPATLYYWDGNDLTGELDGSAVRINQKNNTYSKQPHAKNVVDESTAARLERATSTPNLFLIEPSLITRHYELPTGDWRFAELHAPYTLLKNDRDWLTLNLRHSPPDISRVSGDYPRWFSKNKLERALFVQNNEIWFWQEATDPELLWRQTAPVVQVAWQRSGEEFFVATQQDVLAVSLDDRGGRLSVPLAHFDSIHDLTVLNRTLYIAGSRGGQEGIWELEVE